MHEKISTVEHVDKMMSTCKPKCACVLMWGFQKYVAKMKDFCILLLISQKQDNRIWLWIEFDYGYHWFLLVNIFDVHKLPHLLSLFMHTQYTFCGTSHLHVTLFWWLPWSFCYNYSCTCVHCTPSLCQLVK